MKINETKELSTNNFLNDDYGAGFEAANQSDYAVPIIRILQKGSPQCEKSDSRYVKGSEAGMIYNTVDDEVYSGEEGILVIPVYFNTVDIEYVPRTKGGGFVAIYGFNDKKPEIFGNDEKGKPLLANGNTLVRTAQHFILLKKGDSFVPCLMPMESTNLSISRNWLTFMREQTVEINGELRVMPMYGYIYRATTQIRHKDNNTWYVWRITKECNNKEHINMARNSYNHFRVNVNKIVQDSELQSEELNEEF